MAEDKKMPTFQLLEFLEKNGTTSIQELQKLSFFGGVRSRIPEIVKQGRIERVKVHNENTGTKRYERNVLSALKFKSYEFKSKKGKNINQQARIEKIKQTWHLKNIEKQKKFLEENGYEVKKL